MEIKGICINSISAFLYNGLIFDFIMSSCLTMIENMKRDSLKFWKSLWKSLSFPYKTSLWEKLILQQGFRSQYAEYRYLYVDNALLKGDTGVIDSEVVCTFVKKLTFLDIMFMKFFKIPPDRNFGWIRRFFEPRMGFRITISI